MNTLWHFHFSSILRFTRALHLIRDQWIDWFHFHWLATFANVLYGAWFYVIVGVCNPRELVNPYRELQARDGVGFEALGKGARLLVGGLHGIGGDACCKEQDAGGGYEELHAGGWVGGLVISATEFLGHHRNHWCVHSNGTSCGLITFRRCQAVFKEFPT